MVDVGGTGSKVRSVPRELAVGSSRTEKILSVLDSAIQLKWRLISRFE